MCIYNKQIEIENIQWISSTAEWREQRKESVSLKAKKIDIAHSEKQNTACKKWTKPQRWIELLQNS
jgi:hypothetical protein